MQGLQPVAPVQLKNAKSLGIKQVFLQHVCTRGLNCITQLLSIPAICLASHAVFGFQQGSSECDCALQFFYVQIGRRICVCAPRCSHQVAGRCLPQGMSRWGGPYPYGSSYKVRGQAGRKKGRAVITLGTRMSLHQGRIGGSLVRGKRTPHQKVPGRKRTYPPVTKIARPIGKVHQCRIGCSCST